MHVAVSCVIGGITVCIAHMCFGSQSSLAVFCGSGSWVGKSEADVKKWKDKETAGIIKLVAAHVT